MKNKSWIDLLFWGTAITIAVLFAFGLSSCQTAKNLPRHNDKYPLAAAEYAAKRYPVKESIGAPVVDSTKKADNQDYTNLIDSVATLSDSLGLYEPPTADDVFYDVEAERLRALIAKLRREYKPCKPDSVFITRPHFIVDGAAIEAASLKSAKYKQDMEAAEKSRDEWKGKAKVRFWMLISSWLILLLFIGIAVGKYIKRIPV